MPSASDAAPASWPPQDDAVSPVIGVILMVAITVVLAATVFILVSDFGQDNGSRLPNIAFDTSESQDNAEVIAASTDARWEQLEIRLSVDGGYAVNAAATSGTAAGDWVVIGTGDIGASDYLHFCVDVEGPLTVDVRYIDRNTLLEQFNFNSVASC